MTDTPHPHISLMDQDEVQIPPAAGIFEGAAPADPQMRRAAMERDGFLVLRGVLDAAELAELDNELQRIATSYRGLTPIREGFNVERSEKWPDAQTPVFRKIGGIYDHSPAFQALCRHPRLLAELQNVMSEHIRLWRDVVMMKQAKIGREKPWHQDSAYWPWKPCRQVSIMTALDPMTLDNGCLQVIPGSHHAPLPHRGKESQIGLTPELQAQTRYVPLAPGDSLLFHGLLLHASEPNHSQQHRRVIIFSYMPADLEWTGQGEVHWAADIC